MGDDLRTAFAHRRFRLLNPREPAVGRSLSRSTWEPGGLGGRDRAASRAGAVAALAAGILVTASLGLVSFHRLSSSSGATSGGQEPCSAVVTKTLHPASIRQCEESQVSVGVWPWCPGLPVHIVFIVDEVYKPDWHEPSDRTRALSSAIDQLEMAKHPEVRAGVVWMQAGGASTRLGLTNDPQSVKGAIYMHMVSRFQAKQQCFECGYREAVRLLSTAKENPDVQEVVVLAPMGVFKPEADAGIVSGANQVKRRGATSVTSCFGYLYCVPALIMAASRPSYYVDYGEGLRLGPILRGLVASSFAAVLSSMTGQRYFPGRHRRRYRLHRAGGDARPRSADTHLGSSPSRSQTRTP